MTTSRPLPARVRIADGSIRDGCAGTATRRLKASGRLYVRLDGLVYDERPLFCVARDAEVEWMDGEGNEDE